MRRVSRVEKVRAAARAAEKPQEQQQLDLRGLAELIVGGPLLPTQEKFIFSPERVKWYTGPVGSAKTTSLVASVILPCMLMPGSRWLVARWTYWTLEETTMRAFDEALRRIGSGIVVDELKGPPRRIWIAPAVNGPNGEPGEPSEIIFQSLDDIGKLGSTEFTGVAVDEATEIDAHMASTLNSRLRAKRPGQARAEGPYFLNMVSNPPPRTHWLHEKFCEGDGTDEVKMGIKFNPEKGENEQNLPPGYYDQISVGMSPEMKVRMVYGQCGPDPSGKGIFPEFNLALHAGPLRVVTSLPMIRSWDFGRRRPACVWAQQTPEGWVNRHYALLGENESTRQFAQKVLMLSGVKFPVCGGWIDFCDPHGTAKKSTSDESDIDVLIKLGINPRYRDVAIKTGLEQMSKGLNTLIKGRPQSMYDEKGCTLLTEGYGGGYKWPKGNTDKPLADGYYEHPMDCDRYLMVNLLMGSTSTQHKQPANLRRVRNPVTGY